MTEQINLFPLEVLPERKPLPPSVLRETEPAKDPGCYIVRARFRDGNYRNIGRGLTFPTLSGAEGCAERLDKGWNHRRIYHLTEPTTGVCPTCGGKV